MSGNLPIPTPPQNCGTASCLGDSTSESSVSLQESSIRPSAMTSSGGDIKCDGSCSGVVKKNALTSTTLSPLNAIPEYDAYKIATQKIDCNTPDYQTGIVGAVTGLLGLISGGLSSSFLNPMSSQQDQLKSLQDRYDNLNTAANSCLEQCRYLIQENSYKTICCSMKLLHSSLEVELEEIKEHVAQNTLKSNLSLALIALIFVYILTS